MAVAERAAATIEYAVRHSNWSRLASCQVGLTPRQGQHVENALLSGKYQRMSDGELLSRIRELGEYIGGFNGVAKGGRS